MKLNEVRDGERLAHHIEQVLKLYHYSTDVIKYTKGKEDNFNISIQGVKPR